jgi:ribonuclease-3
MQYRDRDGGHGRDDDADQGPCGSVEPLTKEALENILGFKVASFPALYLSAFTHKSAAAEVGRPSYETLEFLGDSVINLVTARYLYDKYDGHQNEGFMTRLRTRLTCSTTLASLARELRLSDYVVFNSRGLARHYNENSRTLEDVFEALVGACFVCEGLHAARTFFLGVIEKFVDQAVLLHDNNYKDRLMRYLQADGLELPVYTAAPRVTDRGTVFIVSVTANGKEGRGVDTTKKGAEQKAARSLLITMGISPDD